MMRLFLVLFSTIALNFQITFGQNHRYENLSGYPLINFPFTEDAFDIIDKVSNSILQQYPDLEFIEVEIEYYMDFYSMAPTPMQSQGMPLAVHPNNSLPYDGFDISVNPYLFTEFANLISSWSYPDCSYSFYHKAFYDDRKFELSIPIRNLKQINPNNYVSFNKWAFVVGPGERNRM